MKDKKSIKWTEKMVKLTQLKPYERNPRRITEQQYERLKSSLRDNGYHQRIIATPDLRIIGGHQRIKALAELGFTEVQVLVPSENLSDAQFRRLLVQDNLPFGEFDFDILSADFEPAELIEWGMPESWLPVFKPDGDGLTDPDELPGDGATPVSVRGDIWLLGDHRLMCGDSTVATDVERLLAGVTPHLMVTDPPYGVEYDANWRNERARTCEGMGNRKLGAGAVGKVENDDQSDWREAWGLFPGEVAYVWHADLRANIVFDSLMACDFEIRAQIIWAKQQFAIGRGHYHFQHEPCWYAVRKGATGHWQGDRKQSTLWQIDKPQKSETGHSTQKPVECMKRPIENNSAPGDSIYDPFSGSGTTIIACEQTGRLCFAMEISPAYIDLAIRRWQNFTGKEAVHAETGERFNSRI